ncbi:hypothetical protein [Cryptosporangium phraense]|uniref:Uncharacterized protein n=1 Tax=Cryptosporangium phraense TaxID=2593070 RepID=A0A545B2F6_9ACTN|nr:hypothetical protein [Cryptosporangium phraense]TQS47035.1 hypothetical protein FL583_01895 [Cryptosporangium phraense]
MGSVRRTHLLAGAAVAAALIALPAAVALATVGDDDAEAVIRVQPITDATGSPAAATGSTSKKPFFWAGATLDLPWTDAPFLSDGGSCPGGRITFIPNTDPANPGRGDASRPGYEYHLGVAATADVTRDGRPDDLIRLSCDPADRIEGGWTFWYLYSVVDGKPVLRDFVTSAEAKANATWNVASIGARRGAIDTEMTADGAPGLQKRVFRWTGRELVPDKPLAGHPEADTAPR